MMYYDFNADFKYYVKQTSATDGLVVIRHIAQCSGYQTTNMAETGDCIVGRVEKVWETLTASSVLRLFNLRNAPDENMKIGRERWQTHQLWFTVLHQQLLHKIDIDLLPSSVIPLQHLTASPRKECEMIQ